MSLLLNTKNFISNQRYALIGGGLFVFSILLIALFLYRAGPGPKGQEVLGLVIGNYSDRYGVVKMSGRQLDCQPLESENRFTSHCTLTLRGEKIEILAKQNNPDEPWYDDGECQASVSDQVLSCAFGSPVIGIHWYAYLTRLDSFTTQDMNFLRWRYFFENRPEPFFLKLAIGLGMGTAVFGAWNLWFVFKKRPVFIRVAAIIGSSILLFYGTIFSLVPLIFNFVD